MINFKLVKLLQMKYLVMFTNLSEIRCDNLEKKTVFSSTNINYIYHWFNLCDRMGSF